MEVLGFLSTFSLLSLAQIQLLRPLPPGDTRHLILHLIFFLPWGHPLLGMPSTFHAQGPLVTNPGGSIWVDSAMEVKFCFVLFCFDFTDLKTSNQVLSSRPSKLRPSSH